MLGGGSSIAIASMRDFMANWSTPAVLFCVLNLMIATIFIASNFKSPDHSIPSQLTRSPSLLERVKSINFSSFFSTHESYDPHHDSFPTESEQLSNSPSELTRAPSLMDRIKSLKLVSPFNSDQRSSQDDCSGIDSHHELAEDHSVTSDNLLGVTPVTKSLSNLAKSGREKSAVALDGGVHDVHQRQPTTLRGPVEVHDESVDAKADDFIKRFKQQLKLQRLDSLQRWRKMLNRETS